MSIITFDTEVTGLDPFHGAQPFFVTLCEEDGTQHAWEWDVDPLTRKVVIPTDDVEEILDRLFSADAIVGQNIRFDVTALSVAAGREIDWPWYKTHDTLIAGHLLASNQPHDLTSMTLHYLGWDITPFEDALGKAVKEARRYVQQAKLRAKRLSVKQPDEVVDEPLATWRIADTDLPEMPSAKGEVWRADYWLPRAMALHQGLPTDTHPWYSVLRDYANMDSASTMALWKAMEKLL
jgi:hypothetical protein